MERCASTPRPNWAKTVEGQGFFFHTPEGVTYWDESAYYAFAPREIDAIEEATLALNGMCLKACGHVIEGRLFDRVGIPASAADLMCQSWERDELTVYGRFDFAYDGKNPPKLLEFNADTPTALLEAGVVQWFWMKDVFPDLDQFNSLHEKLIEAWRRVRSVLGGPVHFAAMGESTEDFMTAQYLRDTAVQAGLETEYVDVDQIGFDHGLRRFVDGKNQSIKALFKLYPWEWMLAEEFGSYIATSPTAWLEAPWKAVLSSKGILAILWELFPDSPYLLPASFEQGAVGTSYAVKPLRSREGANVSLVRDGRVIASTPGPYEGPVVYQALANLPEFNGRHPILGSWLINGYAAGMGIREDAGLITGNLARFIPHVIR